MQKKISSATWASCCSQLAMLTYVWSQVS